jgi:hypothetical protein
MKRFHLSSVLVAVIGLFALGSATAMAGDVHQSKPQNKAKCSLKSEVAIGGPDADDPAQFYEKIGSSQVDADGAGNIYVLDSGNTRVQVFAPDGSYLRTVGQEGGGPGEFKLPNLVGVNAEGILAVFDMGQQRVSVFDPKGELIRDQVVAGMVRSLAVTDDNKLILVYEPERGVEIEAFDLDGNSLWSVGTPHEPAGEMMIVMGQAPLSPLVAVSNSGDVFKVRKDEYGLEHIKDGAVAAVWTRDYERAKFEMPRRGDDEDGEGGGRMVMITVEDDGGGEGASVNVENSDGAETHTFDMGDMERFMPEYLDDLRGVVCWPDGRLWVFTSKLDGEDLVVDEWSVSGDYLRRLTLPDYEWFKVGANGELYGVGHDDDDYPIVHRLSVQTAS